MMAVLLLFILILNIVSIVLMYYCLGDIDKKEKFIFIAVSTGIMYILTSIIYWISTMGIEITEVSETGKNLITFLFVPVNGLIILPIFAKSYSKLKFGNLSSKVFFNRGLVLGVVLLIILIFECIYFKNIQKQVVELINNNIKMQQENSNKLSGQEQNNNIINNQINDENRNNINYILDSNQINSTQIDEINSNVVSNGLVNKVEE